MRVKNGGGAKVGCGEECSKRTVLVMANFPAIAIANEFLRRRGTSAYPQQMLIQKLSYIANGWNLAINGEPLIDEQPEAWDNGPVYRSIWDNIKESGYNGDQCLLIDPVSKVQATAELNEKERAVVEHVWRKYGNYSANLLSKMTHESNTPWSNTYFTRGRNAKLRNDEIKQHYVDLAMAGRGQ